MFVSIERGPCSDRSFLRDDEVQDLTDSRFARTFFSVGCGALIGALTVVVFGLMRLPEPQRHSPSTASEASVGNDTVNVAALRAEVQALRNEVRRIPAEVDDDTPGVRSSRSHDRSAAKSRLSIETIKRRERQQWEQARREVHAPFAEQNVDVAWAADQEEAVWEFANESGLDVLDAECRTTMCPAVVRVGEKSNQERLFETVDQAESPWGNGGRILFEYDETDKPEFAHLYFTRHRVDLAETLKDFWSDK